MVCYKPLQASFFLEDGKKRLQFGSDAAHAAVGRFVSGTKSRLGSDSDYLLSVPCGKCIGCRLEKSRQWAVRCMHEASLHEENCFLTLTYRPDALPAGGTLVKRHFQLFMKKLRQAYSGRDIRYYMCGEYGDNFGRPHYHACIFGLDFEDKVFWKKHGDYPLYTSAKLEKLWGLGFCSIGGLSFDSAAYVARYCTKKVTGKDADTYYNGRQPEYGAMSLKPAIGLRWYEQWKGDAFPSDYLIVNGVKCKPPRYYDRCLEREDPDLYARIKQRRLDCASDDDDSTYRRLLDREQCQQARFKKLIRTIEVDV